MSQASEYYEKRNSYYKYIQSLAEEKNYEKALSEYRKYIKKYSYDNSAYIEYANISMKLGKFNQAKEALDKAQALLDGKRVTYFDIIKVNLYYYMGQYKNAYDYFVDSNLRNHKRLYVQYLFLKKQVGLAEEMPDDAPYLYKQIYKYSENDFYNHVIERHVDIEEGQIFNSNFPLSEFVEQIKPILSVEDESYLIYKIYNSCMDYYFLFKYDKNGKVAGKEVDYIKVIVLNNSSDIITMYPYENIEQRPALDLTPVQKKDTTLKRSLSAIDKFNQKYNIK